jgi:heme/copper-type cytochrome/quinol oxidase subunit 2
LLRKLIIFSICLLLFIQLSAIGQPLKASAAPQKTRNELIITEPRIGGVGYDQFFPQTIVVNEGDQVNITVRNRDDENFYFNLEMKNIAVTVDAGTRTSNGMILPVDTIVPTFTASEAGIYRFYAQGHDHMDGYLVVLPSIWAKYNPQTQAKNLHLLVLPDFGGDGYDKFFPATLVVNQGDKVSITVRNTDDMPHGFALPAYEIDTALNPGTDLANGSIAPYDTRIQPFVAVHPGIFRFLCTTYCGSGHTEMVGTLVVLPREDQGLTVEPTVTYYYITVVPEFGGKNYNSIVPGTMFVFEQDLVYAIVRNRSNQSFNFVMEAFHINKTVLPARGGVPTDTYITPFFATKSGIYDVAYTSQSGLGGTGADLIVVPSMETAISPITFTRLTIISLGILIVGIGAGFVAANIRKGKKATYEIRKGE